jgi:hypothetical protein
MVQRRAQICEGAHRRRPAPGGVPAPKVMFPVPVVPLEI